MAMGGLTIKKAYDRVCLEDFQQTCSGRVVGGLGEEGVHCLFYGSTLYCLQSAFSLRICQVSILASAIANPDVTL